MVVRPPVAPRAHDLPLRPPVPQRVHPLPPHPQLPGRVADREEVGGDGVGGLEAHALDRSLDGVAGEPARPVGGGDGCPLHEKAIARFLRQGFVAGPRVVLPEVDIPDVFLPEKHAQLAFLPREVAFP